MANEIPPRAVLTRISASAPAAAESAEGRNVMIVVVGVPVLPRQELVPARHHPRPARRLLPLVSRTEPRRFNRRFDRRFLWLLPVAAAGLWSAQPSGSANNERGFVRILLPPPTAYHPTASELSVATKTLPSAAAPRPSGPIAALTAALVKPVQHPARPGAALMVIDELPQVRAATGLALRSGVAQRWQANGLEGLAVAGPIQIQGSNVCRTVAVLADGGGGGQTVNSLRCMTRGGGWVRQPAPALPDFAQGSVTGIDGPNSVDSGEAR